MLNKLKKEINSTLKTEKQTFKDGDYEDKNIQGWIEALEYVIREINLIEDK